MLRSDKEVKAPIKDTLADEKVDHRDEKEKVVNKNKEKEQETEVPSMVSPFTPPSDYKPIPPFPIRFAKAKK